MPVLRAGTFFMAILPGFLESLAFLPRKAPPEILESFHGGGRVFLPDIIQDMGRNQRLAWNVFHSWDEVWPFIISGQFLAENGQGIPGGQGQLVYRELEMNRVGKQRPAR